MTSPPPPESYLRRIEALLHDVIRLAGFDLTFLLRKAARCSGGVEAPEFVVEFIGPDSDLLLERNGALLDALEYTVLKAVHLDKELFGKITFDCADWRQTRALELTLTAQVAAERALTTGNPFALGAMTPRERRIVHLALRDQPGIQTKSEGAGDERHVVILPVASSRRAPST